MKNKKESKVVTIDVIWIRGVISMYLIIISIVGLLAYLFIYNWVLIYILGFSLWFLGDTALKPFFIKMFTPPSVNFFFWLFSIIMFFILYYATLAWSPFLGVAMVYACILFSFSIARYLMHRDFFKWELTGLLNTLFKAIDD